MDAAQFRLPVRIQSAPGEPISEVYSAEQALDLLLAGLEWCIPEGSER